MIYDNQIRTDELSHIVIIAFIVNSAFPVSKTFTVLKPILQVNDPAYYIDRIIISSSWFLKKASAKRILLRILAF
jgi:hypothetical protein